MQHSKDPEKLEIDVNNPLELFLMANELNVGVQELINTIKRVGLKREVVSNYLNAKLKPFLQL